MPSLTIDDIRTIQDKYPTYRNIRIFVETGTLYGQTILHMSPFFDHLYTIEIKEEFYKEILRRSSNRPNIKFYLGDSAEQLPLILKEFQQPAVFFLDGHYSHGPTGRGSKDTPLLEELQAIDEHNQDSLIIIDDCCMFGKNETEDWSEITETNVLTCFSPQKIVDHYITNNRYIILLKKHE